MIHNVKVNHVHFMDEYDGRIEIEVNNQVLNVLYLAPYNFAKKYLCTNNTVKVDLWLINGKTKIVQSLHKKCSTNSAYIIEGQVKKIFNDKEFRVDFDSCVIDILNEEAIEVLINKYVEVSGSYQIFFPDTEYSKEKVWD